MVAKKVRGGLTLCLPVVLFAFLSGCMMVGPDYEIPETEVVDAWSQSVTETFTGGTPALETWWTVFDDAVLLALIEKAGAENLDLKTAAARIEESRAQHAISRGEKMPDLDASGSAQWARASEKTTPVLPDGISRDDSLYNFGGAVAWELDVWGRVRRSIESAGAAYEASIENYRDVLVILYSDVAATYIDVRSLQLRIQYAEINIEAQEETLQLTKDRNEAGLVSMLDVRQAELNRAVTAATIPQLVSQLTQAKNRLAVLTGQTPGALHEVLGGDVDIPAAPEDVTVGLPADLLRQRPDIRRVERQLASQSALIGVAKANLYPVFSLPGTFTLEAFDSSDIFSSGSLKYGFGPAFRWNLFDGGRVRNAVKVEEARTLQALHEYENTVLRALEEVENSMVNVVQEQRRQELLGAAVAAADESSKIAKTLYRSGLKDFQSVLDAERALAAQQDQWAESRGQSVKNYIRLYKSLGGGWNVSELSEEESVKK